MPPEKNIIEAFRPRFLGVDLSLNHAGFVLLDKHGDFLEAYYAASTVTSRKAGGPVRTTLIKKPPKMTRQRWNMERLIQWDAFLTYVLEHALPCFVSLEDYAYGAKTNSAYQIGELGGLFRLIVWDHMMALRLHEPTVVKLFAVGSGRADATTLLDAIPSTQKKMFLRYCGSGKNKQTAEDLAVAYWLARMVYYEFALREGDMLLKELQPHERRIFLRVTKTYPINILDREWIRP
jgi:Holliday junction resolvasome RuvABC endonuclease subunit